MGMTDPSFIIRILEILTYLFVFFVGSVFLALVALYIIDVTQTKQAVRRNFPIVGRFRYLFENMGKFFRQYFFAMDRRNYPLIALNVVGYIALPRI